MTTIAWDGRTLAADKASWSGGFHQQVCKVRRITSADGRRFLVAVLGDASFATNVMRWMSGEIEHPGQPLADNLSHDCALVIDERRRIWRLSCMLVYQRYEGRVHAAGAGQEIAMGALMAGADAIKAVRITMKCSDSAGRGVDYVRF